MISKKISYFITLAECLSFTQTAARYEVSQTAVSQYIASLEDRIGFRLFDRNRHNVALTEAGKYYYQHVKSLVSEYDNILDHAKVITDGYHGCLKVGVGMYEYCSTEALFSAFLTSHPEIRVDILQFPYSELIEKLRSGDLDIIIADSICESSFSRREIRTRLLFHSDLSIVADPSVAETHNNDAVHLLRNECLITNCESDGPASTQMLSILLQDEYGFVPEKISQTNSVNAQLMMVRAKHGIAIVPDFIVNVLCTDVVRFPFPSGRKFRYELIYMNDCKNEAAEQLFNFEF